MAMETEMSCAQRASWATLIGYFPVKNANIPVIKMALPTRTDSRLREPNALAPL